MRHVPGYAEALRAEARTRSAPFVELAVTLCGVEVRPLTVRDYERLSFHDSPFVRGGDVDRADVAFLLYHQRSSPSVRLNPKRFGEDEGIEIKCPRPQTHVKYLLQGELPKEYALQVHGSLFVTGCKRWHFLSYCRRFPAFLVSVERDESIMDKLRSAIASFTTDFEAGLAAVKSK